MSNIRDIVYIGSTSYISLPKEVGFKKGDSILVEKIDENSCKLTKVEWRKIE